MSVSTTQKRRPEERIHRFTAVDPFSKSFAGSGYDKLSKISFFISG